jgi:hypothetical protein
MKYLYGEDYGSKINDCYIVKEKEEICSFSGDLIPENEPHLIFYGMRIRVGRYEILKDIINRVDNKDISIDSDKENIRIEFKIRRDRVDKMVCEECGESILGDDKIFIYKKYNSLMGCYTDTSEVHYECIKRIHDTIGNYLEDIREDYNIISRRL